MKKMRFEIYDGLRLCNIRTDEALDFDVDDADYIRIMTPATQNMQFFFEKQGYFHAERMLKATINLQKTSEDIKKKIRLEIKKTREYKEEIKKIARKSFPTDRRFHVGTACNPQIAEKILNGWIDQIEEFHVCIFHDTVVGFAALRERESGIYEIHLAAVDEDYRMSGAAVSLYASLVWECKHLGGRQLYGWISSANMPVLNLYCSLGAVFSNPSDIFLKEIR